MHLRHVHAHPKLDVQTGYFLKIIYIWFFDIILRPAIKIDVRCIIFQVHLVQVTARRFYLSACAYESLSMSVQHMMTHWSWTSWSGAIVLYDGAQTMV